MIGLTSLITKNPPMWPKFNRRRAVFVLTKIGEILAWEQKKEVERDTKFVELGRYLCEVRLGQYWRLENLKSFDEFLEKRFPESRRKAYYLMSIHEHLPPQVRKDLKEVGWTKGVELAKLARSLTVVRSFQTNNAGHNLEPIVSADTLNANIGSLYARVAGANRPGSGMPTSASTPSILCSATVAWSAFSAEKQMPRSLWPSSSRSLSLAVMTATLQPLSARAASSVGARSHFGSFIMTSTPFSASYR